MNRRVSGWTDANPDDLAHHPFARGEVSAAEVRDALAELERRGLIERDGERVRIVSGPATELGVTS